MAYRWLQELLDLLLPELEDLPAGPAGAEKAQAWFERLLVRFVERGLSTPAQQKNRVVDARNAIRARFGDDHPSLAYVGFDERTWQKINLPTHDRTEARNEHQRLLRRPEKIVARAAKLLESAQFEDLAVGLALCTGRRMSELLDGHAKFEAATTWSVRFTGQRKHKGDRETFSFEIPTLAPAERVLRAWGRLAIMLGDEVLDPQTINNRYGHQVNQAADQHFRGLIPPRPPRKDRRDGTSQNPHTHERREDALYLHLFRAVYATIAVHWFCPPRVNRLVFKAEIQGHRRVLEAPTRAMRRSYTAARHYDDYQVADASGQNLDGRQGIMLGKLEGVEVLQTFQKPAQAEEAAAVSSPAPELPKAALPSLPPATSPDAPMATQEPPDHAADPEPTTSHAEPPQASKEKKPRPVTYRIYPADRPRLDAFRADPKQPQADNLAGVLDLLENASAAIRDQDQARAQLQAAQEQAEQMTQECDQARLEAQEQAERLQTQEGELQRLQGALVEAQAAAAKQAGTAAGSGATVALAVVARELLALATGTECPPQFQGRLISLATQALGNVTTPALAASHQEKRQDGSGRAAGQRVGQADGSMQSSADSRTTGEEKFFGPLFAGGGKKVLQQETIPADADGTGDGQNTLPQTEGGSPTPVGQHEPEPAQEEPVNKEAVVAKTFTRRGGAAEKLEKALQAVVAHNEAQSSRESKWALTESSLARLTGCFRPAIRTFFDQRATEIQTHNHKHHLTGGHNAARGKKGETIEEEVGWRGAKRGNDAEDLVAEDGPS